MTDFRLDSRIALITGASRGIGQAIAGTLAAQGATCILVSRKPEALEKTADMIRDKGGIAEAMACHVGDTEQIRTLTETVASRFGKLDVLVNNAATNPFFGEMIDAPESAWDKTFDVNLKGPFLMIQAAARLMKKNGSGGSIINVASVNGVRPAPYQGIYSITKAGLISMTKGFAKELAKDGIRVNALLPGFTETKFSSAITSDEKLLQYVMAQIPLKRIARPDEMTGAALFLASDASSYTTGTCITCDGGLLA